MTTERRHFTIKMTPEEYEVVKDFCSRVRCIDDVLDLDISDRFTINAFTELVERNGFSKESIDFDIEICEE